MIGDSGVINATVAPTVAETVAVRIKAAIQNNVRPNLGFRFWDVDSAVSSVVGGWDGMAKLLMMNDTQTEISWRVARILNGLLDAFSHLNLTYTTVACWYLSLRLSSTRDYSLRLLCKDE